MDYRDYLINAGIAVTSAVSTFFAIKGKKAEIQAKHEDTNVVRTGQALETWQHLAESNKHNWDTCEEKVNKLNQRIDVQEIEIDKLRDDNFVIRLQMNQLQLQIAGKANINEPTEQHRKDN